MYRIVELSAKRHSRWVDKAYVQFSWPSFSRLLLNAGIDIAALRGFRAIEELRLLNNCIKHEGKVGPELAKYPGWTVGGSIHPLKQVFDRLSSAVPEFVEALARATMPAKLGGHRPDQDVFPPQNRTEKCP